MYPLNTSMEQMADVNNRQAYVWTAEEVKLFLALIEEKNITANLNGKQLNYTIYQDTDRWSADEVHGGELLFGLAVTSQG